MDQTSSCTIDTPLGRVELRLAAGAVTNLRLVACSRMPAPPRDGAARRATASLRAYFCGHGDLSAMAVAPRGTPFQQRVWAALRRIPHGQTRGYGELARELDTSARAIGGACAANPVPLFIPCHRVVAVRGLGGFSLGKGLEVKRWLLEHEGLGP